MRIHPVILAAVLALLLLEDRQSMAQNLGTAISYQGRLTEDGMPYTGTVDLQFALWDADAGGAQIGSTIDVNSVSVDTGLFSADVDFGPAAYDGNARWLQITVDGTPLSPRQRLAPTAYALALPGLRTVQDAVSPNVLGGHSQNSTQDGAIGVFIGGGGTSAAANIVAGEHGVIAGGIENHAGFNNAGIAGNSAWCTIGGGRQNQAQSSGTTVGGGTHNIAGLDFSVVAGGTSNSATGWTAVVSGGSSNIASGVESVVCGGFDNEASGDYSIVLGGYEGIASGDYSLAAGENAEAIHQGSFVWADSQGGSLVSTANDEFSVRASGGVRFFTNQPLSTGVILSAGSGSWSSASDRGIKKNIMSIEPREVLDRLMTVPMNQWSYKSQSDDIRHLGPMAQDFYAAFGVGESERLISSVDADGVALAAIQGLRQMLDEKDQAINELQERLERLERTLAETLEREQGVER